MSRIAVTNRVMMQDESGRFMADIDDNAHEAVWEVTNMMAGFAAANSPFKTGELRRSIRGFMTGPREGVVVATAPHALPQETGASPHLIGESGQVLFRGARSHPGARHTKNRTEGQFGPVKGPVLHPGNPATRYLRKGFNAARMIAPAIFRKHLGN